MHFQWHFLMVPVAFVALHFGAASAGSAKPVKHHHAAHRSGSFAIQQIQPGVSASGALALAAGERLVDGSRRTHALRSGKRHRDASPNDITDALIVAPNPRTEPILAELGIPAIDAVPPIAILDPGEDRHREREIFAGTAGIH